MRTTLSGIYNAAMKRLNSDRLNSLAFRLFATSVLWTLVVLPLTGLVIYSANRNNVLEAFNSRLELLAYGIEAQNFGAAEPVKPENLGEVLFDHSNSGWYWQIQPVLKGDGPRLVSDSLATSSLPSPFLQGAKPNAFDFRRIDIAGPLDQPLRIIERIGRLGDPDSGPRYSFIVAGPLDWPEQKIADFAFDMTIALAIAALGLLIATFFQIRFGLSPLRLIGQGLSDIRSGKAASLGGDLPAEIKPLQAELNALMESNQEIIDRARTQVGNLAHALKTPLAVITNEARDSGTSFAEKVSEQAELMRNQVSHYLDRARVAASVGTIGRITDVQPVAAGLKRALERIYRDKGVSIVLVGTEHARFSGERQDLEEMLGNLLDNACKWSLSEVRLSLFDAPLAGSLRNDMLVFEIEDDGPGLSQEQRAKIGKRGVRLDESTPGTGLGLSIVCDLAASYQGNCTLDASELGGLKVRLELPSAGKDES